MSATPACDVRRADLDDPLHQRAILDLLDMYARDDLGQSEPLSPESRGRLIPGLQATPGCVVFLAFVQEDAVGIVVCFSGFSTFRAQPLLNIHDLAVSPLVRRQGVGRSLLDAVQQEAYRSGCCKVTLEVRNDNHVAQRLYRGCGFRGGEQDSTAYSFWTKQLDSAQ